MARFKLRYSIYKNDKQIGTEYEEQEAESERYIIENLGVIKGGFGHTYLLTAITNI